MAKRILIIGGVAAGPKVAAKLRRLDSRAEITILERGEFLSYAGCGLPYYVSGEIKQQRELMETSAGVMRTPEYFEKTKRISVHNRTEAQQVDREKKEVKARHLDTGDITIFPYDLLVFATGSKPFIPPVPAVDLDMPDMELSCLDLGNVTTLHGIEDAEKVRWTIREKLAKQAVIVGGGLIGMEMTESLVKSGLKVTVIEMMDEILPLVLDPDMGILVRRYCREKGVDVRVGEKVMRLEGRDGVVRRVVTRQGSYPADLVILAAGFRPHSDLAVSCGLETGLYGGIIVDSHMRTRDPNIYAVGDCVETTNIVCDKSAYFPLGSLANKQGRVVANNIAGDEDIFPGGLNSTIFKIFDFTVARTGMSTQQAQEMGIDALYSIVPASDKAHYYPGARRVITKLVAERKSGKILGAQFVGEGEVTKSVNTVACALFYGGMVRDLSNLDIPYAPPYASAIDNVCVAANVLRNKLAGLMDGISPLQVEERRRKGDAILLLDVRTIPEFEKVRIPGSTCIPLAEIRERIEELPRNLDIIIFCAVSARGYEAAIILKEAGYSRVQVMDGGLAVWPFDLENKEERTGR